VLAAAAIAGCGGDSGWTARDVPREYPTIQAAVDAANPGDLIRIAPGVYHQQVVVPPDKKDLVLRGTDRNRVILDGGNGARDDGIAIHANGIAVENLTVRRYGSDGIVFTPAPGTKPPLKGWRTSYVTATNNAVHGIDAIGARGGTVDHVWASGNGGAGIQVGRCGPCDLLVTDSVAERDMVGFEGVNAAGNIVVVRSLFRDNRVGVALVSAGSDTDRHQQDATVVGNVITDNDNRDAPGRGDAFGVGVLVRGGRRDGVARNRISGHLGAGVLLTSAAEDIPAAEDSVQGNVLRDNHVDLVVAPRPGQRTSKGSCFAQNRFSTSVPLDIEKALPCQSDVPLRATDQTLPTPPAPGDWRTVALPPDQPSMPQALTAKPSPARKPHRIDIAKVGVPNDQ